MFARSVPRASASLSPISSASVAPIRSSRHRGTRRVEECGIIFEDCDIVQLKQVNDTHTARGIEYFFLSSSIADQFASYRRCKLFDRFRIAQTYGTYFQVASVTARSDVVFELIECDVLNNLDTVVEYARCGTIRLAGGRLKANKHIINVASGTGSSTNYVFERLDRWGAPALFNYISGSGSMPIRMTGHYDAETTRLFVNTNVSLPTTLVFYSDFIAYVDTDPTSRISSMTGMRARLRSNAAANVTEWVTRMALSSTARRGKWRTTAPTQSTKPPTTPRIWRLGWVPPRVSTGRSSLGIDPGGIQHQSGQHDHFSLRRFGWRRCGAPAERIRWQYQPGHFDVACAPADRLRHGCTRGNHLRRAAPRRWRRRHHYGDGARRGARSLRDGSARGIYSVRGHFRLGLGGRYACRDRYQNENRQPRGVDHGRRRRHRLYLGPDCRTIRRRGHWGYGDGRNREPWRRSLWSAWASALPRRPP